MSMIGLFTTAPQPVGTATAAGDATAAAGFGTALQGVLDALTGEAEDGASLAALAETFPSSPSTASASSAVASPPPAGLGEDAPLTELVETAPVEPGATPPKADDSPESGVVHAVGRETGPSNSLPIPTTVPTALPRVEPVETNPGNTLAPVTTSVSDVDAPTPPSPVRLGPSLPVAETSPESGARAAGGETPTSTSSPVSTGSTSAPVETPASTPLPVSARTASAAAETPASSPQPASTTAATATSSAISTPPSSAIVSADATAVAPTPTAVPASPVSAPQPASSAVPATSPAPVPFATQLARPIFSLAAAGKGEHVMTVSVTPDTLGPVTVRAHVGADGVRVELFAPNDLGRDAIRAILPDLRRDLAGAGLGGNLSLSSQNNAPTHTDSEQFGTGHNSGGAERGESRPGTDDDRGQQRTSAGSPIDQQPATTGPFGAATTIDVLA